MNFTQSLLEAIESLNGNKLRSGLTVLGIVIGVAAVIAMLAVGNGAQASITGSISSIGTNLLFVFSGAPEQGGPGGLIGDQVRVGACLAVEELSEEHGGLAGRGEPSPKAYSEPTAKHRFCLHFPYLHWTPSQL